MDDIMALYRIYYKDGTTQDIEGEDYEHAFVLAGFERLNSDNIDRHEEISHEFARLSDIVELINLAVNISENNSNIEEVYDYIIAGTYSIMGKLKSLDCDVQYKVIGSHPERVKNYLMAIKSELNSYIKQRDEAKKSSE